MSFFIHSVLYLVSIDMFSKKEIVAKISGIYLCKKVFLNGKRMAVKKAINIIENNTKESQYTFKERKQILPFYKGDFLYYKTAYNNEGDFSKLSKEIYYINCIQQGV